MRWQFGQTKSDAEHEERAMREEVQVINDGIDEIDIKNDEKFL